MGELKLPSLFLKPNVSSVEFNAPSSHLSGLENISRIEPGRHRRRQLLRVRIKRFDSATSGGFVCFRHIFSFYRPCQERGVSLHNNTVYYSAVFLFRDRVARFPPLLAPPLPYFPSAGFLAKVQALASFLVRISRPFANLSARSFCAAAAASRETFGNPSLAKSDCDSELPRAPLGVC